MVRRVFRSPKKMRNVEALHAEAKNNGIPKILEISSKSTFEIGKRLSAFSLKLDVNGNSFPLESVYQGSKVFENYGPFSKLFFATPREAKKFMRDKDFGKIVKFTLDGVDYPTTPKNAFYDWIYIKSLINHEEWINKNIDYVAFTDIEFNPDKQVNCQARAFAEYLSLSKKGILGKASSDFYFFCDQLLNKHTEKQLLLQ